MMPRCPRMLVTGFEPFPGAPQNPTEALIAHFAGNPPALEAEMRFAVLPVDYGTVSTALATHVDGFEPDIAIHFGLAQSAIGFRLEEVARNEIAAGRPDNSGGQPTASAICEGVSEIASGLPLDIIETRLRGAGLPVERSRDAGGYLCNYVFYHSCGGRVEGLAAPVAGFIHVPWIDTMRDAHAPGAAAISFDELTTGAGIVMAASLEQFQERCETVFRSELR